MKPKKKSPRRNASAQKESNSQDATSAGSVKKKSKQSKTESLKIATPTDTRLQFLQNEGLIAPEEIASDEDRVPLDFTRLDFKLVGSVHSRYAVRHSHAIFRAAYYRMVAAYINRDLRLLKARKRARLSKKYKTKWQLDDALLGDKEIKELEDDLVNAEAKLTVIEALAAGYEDLRNAASREMFRRGVEKAPND
jgi:hypothetical protein